jgi:hypothetical protein
MLKKCEKNRKEVLLCWAYLLVSSEIHASNAQIVSGPHETGTQLERLVVRIDCLLVSVVVGVGGAQLVPQQVVAGLDLESGAEAVGRLVVLARHVKEHAQAALQVGVDASGVADGAQENLLQVHEIAHVHNGLRGGHVERRRHLVRLVHHVRGVQQTCRLLVVPQQARVVRMVLQPFDQAIESQPLHGLVGVRGGQGAQRRQVVRLELETLAQGTDGLRVLLVLDLGRAQVLPREHVSRILLDGHLEQQHRVHNVVELEALEALLERIGVRLQRILLVELVGLVGVEDLLELLQPRVIRVRAKFEEMGGEGKFKLWCLIFLVFGLFGLFSVKNLEKKICILVLKYKLQPFYKLKFALINKLV